MLTTKSVPRRRLDQKKQKEKALFRRPSTYAEGQYEVVSSRYAAGSGEILATTAIRLLAELHGAPRE